MFLFLLIVGLSFTYADRCSSVPPSLWCSNKELSNKCGFKDLCKRYNIDTYNQRINITILIEALCSDCQQFIVEELYPNIYKNFADFVNIEFIPYGNAAIVNGSIVCQHGPQECTLNRYESCAIHFVEDRDLHVPLFYCIEKNMGTELSFNNITAECFQSLDIGEDIQKKIQTCFESELGEQLQQEAAKRTASAWPDMHQSVPWIIINDVSLEVVQKMRKFLPAFLCEWYKGDKEIPFCQSNEETQEVVTEYSKF